MAERTDDEIKDLYIKWRTDPTNAKCHNIAFCSLHGVPADKLNSLLDNSDLQHKLDSREVTDDEISKLMGLLTRLSFNKALVEKLPVRSLEGLINGIVALVKMRQLEQGKPTEILKITDEEIAAMTPEQRYDRLMSYLRRPLN